MTLGSPRVCAALVCVAAVAACARHDAVDADVHLTWAIQPASPQVGSAVLTLQVTDAAGASITDADVRLEGHMSHAGMAPVLAEGREREPGRYDVPFAFTMAGDWILLVTVVQRDGTRTQRRVDVAGVRPPS